METADEASANEGGCKMICVNDANCEYYWEGQSPKQGRLCLVVGVGRLKAPAPLNPAPSVSSISSWASCTFFCTSWAVRAVTRDLPLPQQMVSAQCVLTVDTIQKRCYTPRQLSSSSCKVFVSCLLTNGFGRGRLGSTVRIRSAFGLPNRE